MWRHTRRGDRYVTVMIDLTPVRHRSGPARLLDVVPGRSKKGPTRPGSPSATRTGVGGSRWWPRGGFTGSRECRRRRAARGAGGDGPLPCRVPGRR